MVRWLRQSTSVDVPIGPFLDQTDGFTAETALTITQPDIRLKKNGGAWAQKNASQTLTHEENGWYEVTLDGTDTNTLGLLTVAIHESGALPVWEHFMVVPAQVWDSYLASDLLQVHAAEISNDLITSSALAASAVGEIADGVWDEDATAHQTQGTFGQVIGDSGGAGDSIYNKFSGLSTLTLSQIQSMIIEGSLTLEGVLRIILSATAGKSHSPAPGQRAYRDVADTKNRILANVNGGDRSTVTLDAT